MKTLAVLVDRLQQAMRGSRKPINEIVADEIRLAIGSGMLAPGERLPSTRALATALGISTVTVASAFTRLVDSGLLVAQVGRGTFVGAPPPAPAAAAIHPASDIWLPAEQPGARQRLVARWMSAVDAGSGLNLVGGYADPRLPPAQGYLRHFRRLLKEKPEAPFAFTLGLGDAAAREAVAGFAAAAFGVATRAEQVFVGASAHQFLDVVVRSFLEPGDVVVCDSPTYYGALDLFALYGLRVATVPSDGEGPLPDALEQVLAIHRPKLLYLTGSPRNPEGGVPGPSRQQQIMALVAAHPIVTVEDSSLFPYVYDQKATPLKSLDQMGQVITLCSFSKMLFAGLRVAAAIASPGIARRLGNALQSYVRMGAALPQQAVAAYVASDRFFGDLAAARTIYRSRRDALAAALAASPLLAAGLRPPAGGLSQWLRLPDGVSGQALCERLGLRRVFALPGDVFMPFPDNTGAIRLSFAQNDEDDLAAGAAAVIDAVAELQRDGRRVPAGQLA
jgi:DNA-binding transcriptional MocR family regulator